MDSVTGGSQSKRNLREPPKSQCEAKGRKGNPFKRGSEARA